jgi:hypothetical protein
MLLGTLKSHWIVSKKNDTSCGWRAGVDAMAVGVEVVAVAGVGVDGSAVAGDTLVVSTLSVVGLSGAGMNSPDTRVIGSDGILDSAKDRY